MKKILLILAILLTVGCSSKDNVKSEETYSLKEYHQIINKIQSGSVTPHKPYFQARLFYSSMNNSYRYDLIIDKPKGTYKNIKCLSYSSYKIDSYHPSLGLFDTKQYSLKSNYIDKGKSYYKGISLSGLVTKKSPLKCYFEYTDDTNQRKHFIFEVNYET